MKLTSLGTPSGFNTGRADRLRSLTYDDIRKMSLSELKSESAFARKTVNANLDRIEKAGLADARVDMTRLSTKGLKTVNDYRKFLMEGVKRLRSKTGTVKGVRDYLNTMENMLPGYTKLTDKQKKRFWEIVDKIRDKKPNLVESIGSTPAIDEVYISFMLNKRISIKTAMKILEDTYEELQERDSGFGMPVDGLTEDDYHDLNF